MKEKSIKEQIMDSLETNKKKGSFTVTKESQEKMNEMRKKIGLPEKPFVEEYELEFLYG